MSSIVDHWWARPNPTHRETVLQSVLRYFSNTGRGINYNTPIPLSWSVEHAADFARAWKHSSDPGSMISLAAHVMREVDYIRLVAKIARLVLVYTYDPRVEHAIEATERWADGKLSLHTLKQANRDVLAARHEAADNSPEAIAASAGYWLSGIPQDREQIDVGGFSGRMVVGSVRDLAIIGPDFYPRFPNSAKKAEGKMAAIIRREFKPTLGQIVLASRR